MKKLSKLMVLLLAAALVFSSFSLVASAEEEPEFHEVINFMASEKRAGYLFDFGQVFGDRGNGYSYGWNIDHSDAGRVATDRALDPSRGKQILDHKLTTLSHFEEGAEWKIEVPNGTYDVTIAVGDLWFGLPDREDPYVLNVNGEEVFRFESGVNGDDFVTDEDFFFETVAVEVTDGQIVLDNGESGRNDMKINYITIAEQAEGEEALEITVNFMPAEGRAGYRYDFGQVFGDRGNGLTYGWSHDHSDSGRIATDRALDPSRGKQILDHKLTTLAHFEEAANWSIEVPNGTYEVTIAMGDLWFGLPQRDYVYGLNVNGQEVITFESGIDGDNFVSDEDFIFETVVVNVTDGKIVLDNGESGHNDVKVNYIEIKSVEQDDAAGNEGTSDDEGTAGNEGSSDDEGTAGNEGSEDNEVVQPGMPKTGMGGTSGMSGAVMIAIVFAAVLAVVMIRKRNGNQA